MNYLRADLSISGSVISAAFRHRVARVMGLIVKAFFVLLLVHASPTHVFAQSQIPTAEKSPQIVVKEFYSRYLKELENNKDPLKDERAFISEYVSSALVKEIEKRMHSRDGMESDYFIQAQDYIDDWQANIAIESPQISGTTSTTAVNLGAEKATRYRLAITLVNEQGSWKIRKVHRL